MKMFRSHAPKWVESDATAEDPPPQMDRCGAAKVALAIWMASASASSRVRYQRRT